MRRKKSNTERAQRICDLMKVLSSPTRLSILCHLRDREWSVGALAEALKLRIATVSQHLALLRKERLVDTRREAQTIYYRLASPQMQELLTFLCERIEPELP